MNSDIQRTSGVKRLVIAGGGAAGWIAAAVLSKSMGKLIDITLVESEAIGTVGVGEATIPTMQTFHKLLGIDEAQFMRAVKGTFKLAISFENWGERGEQYIHSFGTTGQETWAADFQHFWRRGLDLGINAAFGDYCLELQAAKAGKFAITENPRINYAYHLDASKYALMLRQMSEQHGTRRVEGKIQQVLTNPDNGYITALQMENGELIEGDLFVDCTGFRGLLIEQTLNTGYDNWSHWLPCDSALAVQTEAVSEPLPYTRSIAHEFGWQWKIPLQHRVGNGLVYSSPYVSDEQAKERLLQSIEGKPLTDPRLIKFTTGKRKQCWNKNVVALGLASGFIEPLESTSIQLIMTGAMRLLRMFPQQQINQTDIDEYNAQAQREMENIRDFIILHYHVTRRDDSDFWRYCRTMSVPDSLAHRIELFKETGRIFRTEDELFRIDSWSQVMIGQGLMPQQYHPIAQLMSEEELGRFLNGMRAHIAKSVERLPSHQDFIKRYCASN